MPSNPEKRREQGRKYREAHREEARLYRETHREEAREYQRERRLRLGIEPRSAAEHGTNSKYTSGCRCDECRAASARYQRETVARNSASVLSPDDPRHGRPSTYTNYGCRCDACREAWNARMRQYTRARRAKAKETTDE